MKKTPPPPTIAAGRRDAPLPSAPAQPLYSPAVISAARRLIVEIAATALVAHPDFRRLREEIRAGRLRVRVVYDAAEGVFAVGLTLSDGAVVEIVDLIEAAAEGAVGESARGLGLLPAEKEPIH